MDMMEWSDTYRALALRGGCRAGKIRDRLLGEKARGSATENGSRSEATEQSGELRGAVWCPTTPHKLQAEALARASKTTAGGP
jgi:hypothetical protein